MTNGKDSLLWEELAGILRALVGVGGADVGEGEEFGGLGFYRRQSIL